MSSTTELFNDYIASTSRLVQTRDYQREIITKTYDSYEDGLYSILIESATGSGKTIIGLAIAALLQRKYNLGVGWVAMRHNLLTQCLKANAEMEMGVQGLTTISMFDKQPPTHDHDGRPIELIILDEAHHDSTSSMTAIYERIKPRLILGLTATPFRTDRVNICFQRTIKNAGIRQLMELGYLSKYHKYTIPQWKPEIVTKHYLAEQERWGKSAFYWKTSSEARKCYRILRKNGVKVGLILGSHSYSEREQMLADFNGGELQALVNLFVLTEGFDCPSLKTVWVRDSSRGPTIQMSGRVFRHHESTPYKQVVQSKFTKWPIERTTSPTKSFVWMNESWRSLEQNEITEQVTQQVINTLAQTSTTLPTFIKKKQEIKRQRFTF